MACAAASCFEIDSHGFVAGDREMGTKESDAMFCTEVSLIFDQTKINSLAIPLSSLVSRQSDARAARKQLTFILYLLCLAATMRVQIVNAVARVVVSMGSGAVAGGRRPDLELRGGAGGPGPPGWLIFLAMIVISKR